MRGFALSYAVFCALRVFIQQCEIILIRFIQVFVCGKIAVVDSFVGGVRAEGFCGGNQLLDFAQILNQSRTDGNHCRRADRADVLRAVYGLDGSARAVRQNLAGDVAQSTSA